MCHYLGGGLHGKQKRVKAQSESSKSVVNSVLISREMPVFPGFFEIIRVVKNNHTNVNVQARFIVYGTRDLGKELGAISTLVMLENISARIAENAKKGRATWLYIDEFHTVLDREYSAKFLFSLWKKVRKQGGLCTGITQNLVDMLQNYTAMTMLGNSEFIALLKQSNVDSQELSTAAGIPEAQLKYVDNSPSGTGIIKYGNTCIPFDNRMEKEANPLYALFNTNLHEKALQTKQE